MKSTSDPDNKAGKTALAATCSPFWYGVGAFFVAPITALFCILMGVMIVLAWPFIPFLCYVQKKEEASKANAKEHPTT